MNIMQSFLEKPPKLCKTAPKSLRNVLNGSKIPINYADFAWKSKKIVKEWGKNVVNYAGCAKLCIMPYTRTE